MHLLSLWSRNNEWFDHKCAERQILPSSLTPIKDFADELINSKIWFKMFDIGFN